MPLQSSQRSTPASPGLSRSQTENRRLLLYQSGAKSSLWTRWIAGCVAWILVLGAAGITAGGIWLSAQLLLHPDTALWINQYLPAWTRIPVQSRDPLLTLPEILAAIRRVGLVPGEIMPLTDPRSVRKGRPNLLIVVLNPRGQVVELRVYQPETQGPYGSMKEQYFWPVSQIAVSGPEESFVIGPLVNAQSANQGSSRILPLTTLQRFEDETLPPGLWFNLTGIWSQADHTVPYGTVVHYNPDRAHLSLMLQWTSPGGQLPQWRSLTGNKFPDLLLDQTIGLEPQYSLYQVVPRRFLPNPIHLQPVALNEAASGSRVYQNALILARGGLWSPALEWMRSYKRQVGNNPKLWKPVMRGQLALIEIHATFTQTQAEKSWAGVSDQVLANLIDGRWARALTVYEKAEDISEITSLLRSDSGRIRKRVTAALRVRPTQVEVQAWGALLIQARQGKARAIAWLQQHPRQPAATDRIYRLLDKLEVSMYLARAADDSHISQIIGSAVLVRGVDARAWLRPASAPPLTLDKGQVWYQIEVVAFQDGIRWRRTPFTTIKLIPAVASQQLWTLLGIDADPNITISAWDEAGEQQTVSAIVKAARLNGNAIQLLAAGEPPPKAGKQGKLSKPLAMTVTAIQGVEPSSSTLMEVNQQQPELARKLLQNLLQELRNTGYLRGRAPSPEDILQQEISTNWTIQQVDLTGNQQPEYIVTLDAPLLTSLLGRKSRLRSRPALIFSDIGNLLYSELGQEAGYSLTTIVDLGDGGANALIIESPTGYNLWRWSLKRHRFL